MPAESFESPLTLAACGGHTELAALLVERGANMEEVNDEGYTPLMEAVREGHEDVVTLLIHRGLSSHLPIETGQHSVEHITCSLLSYYQQAVECTNLDPKLQTLTFPNLPTLMLHGLCILHSAAGSRCKIKCGSTHHPHQCITEIRDNHGT